MLHRVLQASLAPHDVGMTNPVSAIKRLGGIATRQQLLAVGLTGYDLTSAVRSGRIARVRQARYAVSDASSDAISATRVGGLLAGPSAAASYGLWSGMDARLHISVGQNSARLRTNFPPCFHEPLSPDTSDRRIVVHWLKGGAVPELGAECWRVTLSRCLRQVVAWSDRETAIACLDTAVSQAKTDAAAIGRLFEFASPTDRLVASCSQRGSDSGTESLVRQRFDRLGIEYRQQVGIAGVGRVDFGLVGTRIIVEVDGRRYHEDPIAFELDRWRDAELTSRSYVVIRLSYLRVTTDWPWCVRIILAAMAAHAA